MKKSYLQFLMTIFIIYLTSCSNSQTIQSIKSQSVYDRVMQSGKIRAAYGVYDPGCIKNPNTGKLSGIGVDALETVAKRLGLKVEYTEEVPWGTMMEGLETNRYDMVVTPVWTSSNRARLADFSKPLYFSFVFAYVRPNDNRFKNHDLSQVNSNQFKIATLDGATAQVIANEDFPKAKQLSLPQYNDLSQLLLGVSSGKADLTFAEPPELVHFLKHNPGTLQVLPTKPVRVFPNCWIIKHGQLEFKNMIDTVLDEIINDGTIKKLLDKYDPAPNCHYEVAPPYQTRTGF
jgi:polar amino acid transport system substrate-binding protein